MEKLASNQYLLVQSRSKEDRYDINDASPREIYAIFVPASTMRTLQSSRRRQHRASVVDWDAQAHRTAALYGMRPGVLERAGTLMARSKLPEDPVIRLLKCQRWGVCDAGTADICAVDLKTVHRFQHVAAQRAERLSGNIRTSSPSI